MRPYLYAAVGLALLAVIAYPVLSYLIDKPERPRWRARGSHHRLRWWQRIRDERAQERAQDALNLRLLQGISSGLRGEATRAATSPMRRAEWPLQPLPPGAEEHAYHFHRWAAEPEPDVMHVLADEDVTFAEPGPLNGLHTWEDPLDVATPEQVADAYVGLAGQPG